jgi:putative inorganic carbon (hco3(-)) transporter
VAWRRKLVSLLSGRAALLLAATAVLILAVFVSLSRSALVGLAAALLAGGELARRFGPGPAYRSIRPVMLSAIVAGAALVGILSRVGPAAILERFARADIAIADRVTIWRDAIPVLGDFWLTGTGVGTYQTAMAVYQRSSPGILFNQAHNHYLQLATEGGLLVLLPALGAMMAFAAAGWRSLQSDRSGMYWLRAGAASGLLGVSLQSLWETGLTVPANAALAAVLAAILLHVPARSGPPGTH